MFELARDLGAVVAAGQAWLIGQPLPMQIVAGGVGLAVLWVLWIVLRVVLAALRATFRGL